MQRRNHLSDVTIKRGYIFVDEKQSGKRSLGTDGDRGRGVDGVEEGEEKYIGRGRPAQKCHQTLSIRRRCRRHLCEREGADLRREISSDFVRNAALMAAPVNNTSGCDCDHHRKAERPTDRIVARIRSVVEVDCRR